MTQAETSMIATTFNLLEDKLKKLLKEFELYPKTVQLFCQSAEVQIFQIWRVNRKHP